MINNQVGDVADFLRLKGINMNNPQHYNQVVAMGVNVKNYFKMKEQEQETMMQNQKNIAREL
jgi:hypothetical protein